MQKFGWKTAEEPSPDFVLPSAWEEAIACGRVVPEISARMRRFASEERREAYYPAIHDGLVMIGESFLQGGFAKDRFLQAIRESGGNTRLKLGALDACAGLAERFDGLLPGSLWNTLASCATRENPEAETSIMAVQDTLPYPWYVCDAHLHAMGVTYGLNFEVQAALFETTGHVFIHGCGCDHYMRAMERDAVIRYSLPETLRAKTAREFVDHLASQLCLIVAKGYPFRMNLPEEQSAEVLAHVA